ncbi:hypothetical protein A2U01_0056652, partial [Trifolium medium]|nr:hypothetical protein [Trifolium medium]
MKGEGRIWEEESHMTRRGRRSMKEVVVEREEVMEIVSSVDYRVIVSSSARREM